jgi:hypothetical protein
VCNLMMRVTVVKPSPSPAHHQGQKASLFLTTGLVIRIGLLT